MKITKGNVFDHLGFAPEQSLELKIKADILLAIREHIEKKNYTQKELAEKLRIHQPDASKLMTGRITSVTIDKLLRYAGRLNLGATVIITQPPTAKSTAKVKRSKQALVGTR
jgi:predicted XRE-type DNA-binding protein